MTNPKPETPKVAPPPKPIGEKDIRKILAKKFTKDEIDNLLNAPHRTLSHIRPVDALAVGDIPPLIAWAQGLVAGDPRYTLDIKDIHRYPSDPSAR